MKRHSLIVVLLGLGLAFVWFGVREGELPAPSPENAKLAAREGNRFRAKAVRSEQDPTQRSSQATPDVRAELLAILRVPDSGRRRQALHAWFRSQLPDRLPELRELFDGIAQETNADLFTGFQVFLEEWAVLDGKASYEYILQFPREQDLGPFVRHAIRGWLRQDIQGLWGHLEAQHGAAPPGDLRTDRAVTYFAEAFMDRNPTQFLAWAQSQGPAMNQRMFEQVANTAAHHVAEPNLSDMAKWIQQHESVIDASATVPGFVDRYVRATPLEAADWAVSLESPAHRWKASVQVAKKLAARQPELGFEWLSREEVRRSLSAVEGRWSPEEPSSTAYDAAVEEFLETCALRHGSDPRALNTALRSVNAIQSPDRRQRLRDRLDEIAVTYFGRSALTQPSDP